MTFEHHRMIKRIDVATDIAMIGAWDASHTEQPLSRQDKRRFRQILHEDAEQGRLFLIETGGDVGGPVELYVDAEIPPNVLKQFNPAQRDFRLQVPSGNLLVGGIEDYRADSPKITSDADILTIAPGDYRLRCWIRASDEDEASETELEKLVGAERLRRFDRRNKLGCMAGPVTLLLFPALVFPLGWKIALGVSIVAFLAYWHVLERVLRLSADYRELSEIVPKYREGNERPLFVLQLLPLLESDDLKGGWINVQEETAALPA